MYYEYLNFQACETTMNLINMGKVIRFAIHSEKPSVTYVMVSKVKENKYYLTFHHLDGTEFTSFHLDRNNMYNWIMSQYQWKFLVEWRIDQQ